MKSLSYHLGKRFWQDIEDHHPDADSLRLAPHIIGQWKQRIRTKDKTVTGPDGRSTSTQVEGLNHRDTSPICGPSTSTSSSGRWKIPAAGARGWHRAW